MKDSDFRALAGDLRDHLRLHVNLFMQERGFTYDAEAFLDQSTYDVEEIVIEMLLFGADIFPRSAKEVLLPDIETGPDLCLCA